MLAGEETAIISREELEAELETLHFEAFGCSREERKELNILGAEIPIDWDYYEEPTFLLAERTGLEPATPGVTGRYSNQLNYRSAARTSTVGSRSTRLGGCYRI